MALNFNNPVTSQDRAAVLQSIRDHVVALSKMLDGETLTGTPTGAIRYSSANDQFETWSGSTWDELPLKFLKLSGGTLTGGLTGTSGAFTSLTVGGAAVWHAGNLTPGNYQLASTAWNTSNFDPTTKQNVSTAWHTGNFDPATKQNTSTAWNTGNFDPATKANLSGAAFTGAVSSSASLASPSITATGGGAFSGFQQRDNTGVTWGWYCTGGVTYLWNGSGNAMSVSSGGNMACAGSFTASGDITAYSDLRLKSEIGRFDLNIDQLASIDTIQYTMFGRRGVGVSAQQVKEVVPLAVHEDDDGRLSVDYGRLASVAVFSLARELRARGVL